MEIHIAEISLRQAERHEVTVAFSSGNPVDGTTSWRILPNVNWFKLRIPPLKAAIFYTLLFIRLYRCQSKFDVIHLHGDWSSFVFGPLIRKISPGSRLIFSFHGTILSNFWHRFILPSTLKTCDLLICTGFDAFRRLSAHCHAIYQPSGVRKTFYQNIIQTKEGPLKRCVTTSIFRKEKQIDILLSLAAAIPEMEFVLIGDGPKKNHLVSMATERNLQNLLFKGFLQPADILHQYEISDVFLHTSFFEGTPTAVMEAMVAGLPIIAAHSPGLERICQHGINGLLVPNNSESQQEKFMDAITYLNLHPQLRIKMSKQNRLDSQKFSWQWVSERIEIEMQKVIN